MFFGRRHTFLPAAVFISAAGIAGCPAAVLFVRHLVSGGRQFEDDTGHYAYFNFARPEINIVVQPDGGALASHVPFPAHLPGRCRKPRLDFLKFTLDFLNSSGYTCSVN